MPELLIGCARVSAADSCLTARSNALELPWIHQQRNCVDDGHAGGKQEAGRFAQGDGRLPCWGATVVACNWTV